MIRTLTASLVLLALAAPGRAEVKTKPVEYEYGGVKLKGLLAWDDAVKGKRPGVLVVHEWWGLNSHAKERAEKLAGLGYVAFACDMYGDGQVTDHPKKASEMASAVRANLKAWQGRAKAGLEQLARDERVDPKRLGAIGFCFGGSTALQLAYTGADLAAVVTFHAALPEPTEAQAKAIKPAILVCHGADDPFIPEKAIKAFRAALDGAKVGYQFVSYKGAKHSFTVPGIDKVGVKGLQYDEKADTESWRAMTDHFRKAFAAGER
jgi:dienelactone hydrolase